MQFASIALALAAAAFAAPDASDPIVSLTTYRGANCDQSTITGNGISASPPAGVCHAFPPQVNSVTVRIQAGTLRSNCSIELFEKPDCATTGQIKTYQLTPAENDCKSGFFEIEDLARSAKVTCA